MAPSTPNLVHKSDWAEREQYLEFRLGPIRVGRIRFRASVLTTPFIELPLDVSSTVVTPQNLNGCPVAVIPGHPDAQKTKTIQRSNGLIRYVSFTEIRYLVELKESLASYLKKFSAKRRHNLLRTVKKFTEFSGGELDCKEYRSASEMLEFQRLAVDISQKTYKQEIGWGFQSSEKFGQELVDAAEVGAVRGYVLYCANRPAAYAFCRIQNAIIYYTHIGYDPQFSDYSPGTVLLYVLIERLFEEGRFRYLDFLGGAYWQYKQVFSTVQLSSATLFYFPPTLPNLALILLHVSVRKLESLAVRAKSMLAGIRSGREHQS
jgi:CelD/BcsL family acetyltransferase involved in cellulose biosynthesis